MAGIYIHIPFCKSRCIYCGFYSTTSLEMRQSYVHAVCREMEMRKDELGDKPLIGTLYLGGGTPSQLTVPQLRQLFDPYIIYIRWNRLPEVTIEVQPRRRHRRLCRGLKAAARQPRQHGVPRPSTTSGCSSCTAAIPPPR